MGAAPPHSLTSAEVFTHFFFYYREELQLDSAVAFLSPEALSGPTYAASQFSSSSRFISLSKERYHMKRKTLAALWAELCRVTTTNTAVLSKLEAAKLAAATVSHASTSGETEGATVSAAAATAAGKAQSQRGNGAVAAPTNAADDSTSSSGELSPGIEGEGDQSAQEGGDSPDGAGAGTGSLTLRNMSDAAIGAAAVAPDGDSAAAAAASAASAAAVFSVLRPQLGLSSDKLLLWMLVGYRQEHEKLQTDFAATLNLAKQQLKRHRKDLESGVPPPYNHLSPGEVVAEDGSIPGKYYPQGASTALRLMSHSGPPIVFSDLSAVTNLRLATARYADALDLVFNLWLAEDLDAFRQG